MRLYVRKTIRLAFLTFVATLTLVCSSESSVEERWHRIVNDSSFLWGEAISDNRLEAHKDADADLVKKIQVAISVSVESRRSEIQQDDSLSYTGTFVEDLEIFSSQMLMGLDHLVINEGGQYRVLAYITRDDYRRSLDHRKHRIMDYVNLAHVAEEECRIGDALKHLYWALLLSRTYPDTMRVEMGSISSTIPQTALKEKLGHMIESISADASEVYRDDGVIVAEVSFEYEGRRINNLSFAYYSGLATDYGTVANGRASIPIYDDPVMPTRELVLSIDYASEGELYAHDDLYQLHEMATEQPLENSIIVRLNFPWLKQPNVTSQPPESDTVRTFPPVINVLGDLQSKDDFLRVVQQYKRLGHISYGKRPSPAAEDMSFVALVDDSEVCGLFYYDETGFVEVSSGRVLKSLTDEFQGKRQIWIYASKEGGIH